MNSIPATVSRLRPVPASFQRPPTAVPVSLATGPLARIDALVFESYRSGFVQSLIFHSALLLVLALVVIRPDGLSKPTALSLDFSPAAETAPDSFADPLAALELAVDQAASEDDLSSEVTLASYEPEPPVEMELALPGGLDMVVSESNREDDYEKGDLWAEIQSPARAAASGVGGRAVMHAGPGNGAAGLGAGGRGGIDGELGRRLRAAGAKTGDVQVSIRWDTADDIDVHVKVEPVMSGQWWVISWMNRIGFCGGMLDVDANAHPAQLTLQPVENVFWGQGRAPFGRFTVAVHNYRNWSGRPQTQVEVAVLVDGEVRRFHPTVAVGAAPVMVTSFVRKPPTNSPAVNGSVAGAKP